MPSEDGGGSDIVLENGAKEKTTGNDGENEEDAADDEDKECLICYDVLIAPGEMSMLDSVPVKKGFLLVASFCFKQR